MFQILINTVMGDRATASIAAFETRQMADTAINIINSKKHMWYSQEAIALYTPM